MQILKHRNRTLYMSRIIENSANLYAIAQKIIPGGVNSPVRAFKSVGGNPLFMDRGEGAYIFDVDNNRYIDFVMSWGPLLFGHAPPHTTKAITETAQKGTSFGASTKLEVDLAQQIVNCVPSIEMLRLVNSGTEAVMSAVRAARGFTKKDKVIKFEGNYHGHSDGFLSKAGSGLATFGLPDSGGVPASLTVDTLTVPFNNIAAFKDALEQNRGTVACVIMEPVPGNMGVVPPNENFLREVRDLTSKHQAVLIFDEVISGFRLSKGGAQEYCSVVPDLTTLGKIIGGGLPLAAYGGRREIMETISPVGPVYQAGTLSGNPLASAAGMAQIQAIINNPNIYDVLEERAIQLQVGLEQAGFIAKVPVRVNRVGSMITLFFAEEPVSDYVTAKASNTHRYARFFQLMLDKNVYIAPSQFEAMFLSTCHTEEIISSTIDAAAECMLALE